MWCRSVWIQPKILFGHCWLFFQFFEIDVLTSTTASAVIHCLKRHFARYGIPKCVVSDSGPQIVSSLFADFYLTWRILHVTSSPGHQNENGKAEGAVKSAKKYPISGLVHGRYNAFVNKSRKFGFNSISQSNRYPTTKQHSGGKTGVDFQWGTSFMRAVLCRSWSRPTLCR